MKLIATALCYVIYQIVDLCKIVLGLLWPFIVLVLLFALPAVFIYTATVFVTLEPNPFAWSAEYRGVCVTVDILGALMITAVLLITDSSKLASVNLLLALFNKEIFKLFLSKEKD